MDYGLIFPNSKKNARESLLYFDKRAFCFFISIEKFILIVFLDEFPSTYLAKVNSI